MAPVDPVSLTRSLVDIDSTTGREGEAGEWLAAFLRGRGYDVTEQHVSPGRFNVFARTDRDPLIAFSTHFDCVPPFFPSRVERGLIFGRGSCDAKGILAAQVAAAEQLRARGESRVALLFVVGEERGSLPTIVSAPQPVESCASGCTRPAAPPTRRFPNSVTRRLTSCSTP